jgi:tetratricopeptide (TPR) repeat protein
MGVVTEKEVEEALREQGEEKFLELFSWSEGDVWFEPDTDALPLSTAVEQDRLEELMLRGVQRMSPDALRRGLKPLRGKIVALDMTAMSEGVLQDAAVQDLKEALERAEGRADSVVRQHGAVLFGLVVLGGAQIEGERPKPKPRRPPSSRVRPVEKTGSVTREELEGLRTQASEQTHFQILGVATNAPAADCKSAFFRLAKRYHPDRFSGEPDEIRALASEVFARISTAHEILTDASQRAAYAESLSGSAAGSPDVSQILTAEVQFQKGQALLKKKDYARAREQFRWAMELNPEEGEFRALYGWTTYLVNPQDEKVLAEARQELEKAVELAPRSGTGYYYQGQLFKACRELGPAERMFRKVLELDPDHVEAARELRVFRMRKEKGPDQKGLFGFGRKKA